MLWYVAITMMSAEHSKGEFFVTKISIDLTTPEGRIISSEELDAITKGCLKTLSCLGNLGTMVEAFRVTWISSEGVTGPRFTIYFCTLSGGRSSHTTDFRFMGIGRCDPHADVIFGHLYREVHSALQGHIQKCRADLEAELARLPSA